jgi:alpha,alpha-trehalase
MPDLAARRFDAVLFDLDGVITSTARVHAACWKRMFDEYLERRAATTREPFEPFRIETDYKRHVDGRPRYDGVRAFLVSRGITLLDGAPSDPPTAETVCGLGNRKNELFHETLAIEPPEVYPGSLSLVHALREHGIRTAVVSGSRNAAAVLEAAGIAVLFEVRVDGLTAAERGLAGKPAPDTFLEAARLLAVEPARAVVIEDAASGVTAGRAGGFGLVVGVAREGEHNALREQGADMVVTDLAELEVTDDNREG